MPQRQALYQGKSGKFDIFRAKNRDLNDALVRNVAELPIGFERWCLDYPIDYKGVPKIFEIPNSCLIDTFSRCFQYKVLCQILPTQEYLFKYRVPDILDNQCVMCKEERDTIEHCLVDCEKIQGFLNLVRDVVIESTEDGLVINREHLIFGIYDNLTENKGLNHFLIELKKFIFYTVRKDYNTTPDALLKRFLAKLRFIIIKEKQNAIIRNNYGKFSDKWFLFCDTVYNFNGPDNTNVIFQ